MLCSEVIIYEKNNKRDNLVVFIENLIKKKPDINLVLIESHGFTDVSNVIFLNEKIFQILVSQKILVR